jgi:hypothetical protein
LAYKPATNDLIESINEIIGSVHDVVSGFVKIQNKMYDVYKKKRDRDVDKNGEIEEPYEKTIE